MYYICIIYVLVIKKYFFSNIKTLLNCLMKSKKKQNYIKVCILFCCLYISKNCMFYSQRFTYIDYRDYRDYRDNRDHRDYRDYKYCREI